MDLHVEKHITGLDFNPNGEIVAAIDNYGTCRISDVNTDEYVFDVSMSDRGKEYFRIQCVFRCYPSMTNLFFDINLLLVALLEFLVFLSLL